MRTTRQMLTAMLLATGVVSGLFAPMAWAIDDGERDSAEAAQFRDRERPPARSRDRDRPADERSPRADRFAPEYLPIRPGPDGRWRLGVYAENSSRGVLITGIVPGSAAARAGLERRDIIISVDGYQVGRVDGVLYDLGDELQLRAGPRGDVRLLVWNHRNGQLVNVDVTLSPRRDWLRERSRSPRGSGEPELESDDEVR